MSIIIVKGVRSDGSYGGFLSSTLPEGGNDPFPSLAPDDGQGGGAAGPPGRYEFLHTATCDSADGAAAQVAETIMATDDILPQIFTWHTAGYGAVIVQQTAGIFSAYNNAIYSEGEPTSLSLAAPNDALLIEGIIHNHPKLRFGTEDRLVNRYPSAFDWRTLSLLKARFETSHPNFDPKMWIVDHVGNTRFFRVSDRQYIESLSFDQMVDGQGLDGRLTDNNCPS